MWTGFYGGDRNYWNRCRFDLADLEGHYESYFLRGNHPDAPLAFWIRYTIFCPRRRPQDTVGELWAVWFDGVGGRISAARNEVPLADCRFHRDGLDVRIGAAVLTDGHAEGSVQGRTRIEWSLAFASTQPPALLLPRGVYDLLWPQAKAVASAPDARFEGAIVVDGDRHVIDRWYGTQNHNWGSRHTDEYAWGQVAGFDDMPDAFLECSSARVRFGPLYTPWMTLIVLRVGEEEYRLNSLWQALRARQKLRFFEWTFASRAPSCRIRGRIGAHASAFVALPYKDPPGGTKTCLNSKLAACELTIERRGRQPLRLTSRNRAAFEILTDRRNHGLPFAI